MYIYDMVWYLYAHSRAESSASDSAAPTWPETSQGDMWMVMAVWWLNLYMVSIWLVYDQYLVDNLWMIYGYGWWYTCPSEKYEIQLG